MDFNLSKLLNAVNMKLIGNSPIEFKLTEDGTILSKMGEVSYYFDYKKLQAVLDENEFNHYYKDDTQDKACDLLSKHILNQLFAANGKKQFPEIKTLSSDLL